jgi:hypothetical protein
VFPISAGEVIAGQFQLSRATRKVAVASGELPVKIDSQLVVAL